MRRVFHPGEVPRITRYSDVAKVIRKVSQLRYVEALLIDCDPGELVYISPDDEPAWTPVVIARKQ